MCLSTHFIVAKAVPIENLFYVNQVIILQSNLSNIVNAVTTMVQSFGTKKWLENI